MFAKCFTRDGNQYTRFATWNGIGAYYVDARGVAWYVARGGGWGPINCGTRGDVEAKIRDGRLRGVLDSEAVSSERVGAVVISAGEGTPREGYRGLW